MFLPAFFPYSADGSYSPSLLKKIHFCSSFICVWRWRLTPNYVIFASTSWFFKRFRGLKSFVYNHMFPSENCWIYAKQKKIQVFMNRNKNLKMLNFGNTITYQKFFLWLNLKVTNKLAQKLQETNDLLYTSVHTTFAGFNKTWCRAIK